MLVYKLTCRVTGKSYIGATQNPLPQRLANHRARANASGLKGMYPLSQAIREHGWDSFDVTVLSHARNLPEMLEMERGAITLYRTLHPDGYNYLNGGGGDWLGGGGRGKVPWNRGKSHTDVAKARMSAARIGAKNYRARAIEFNGVTYPCVEDCCKATGLTRQQMYRRVKLGSATYLTPAIPGNYGPKRKPTISPEAREKMSERRTGAKNWHARRILVNGVEYPSILDAVGVSGYTRMQLRRLLRTGEATYLTVSAFVVPKLAGEKQHPPFRLSAETRARMSAAQVARRRKES